MHFRHHLPLLLATILISCSNTPDPTKPPSSSSGMISSASAEATEAGLEILRSGGNAIDAAAAVGFALAVTHPQAGNLGGGGFMVIRMADGRTTTLDFREQAPGAATRDMYLDTTGAFVADRAQVGALAAGVPGTPAGLLTALEKFGSKSPKEVLAPAIILASDGFTVSAGLAGEFAEKQSVFLSFPSTARIFAPGGNTITARTLLKQPELASTLERIADSGMAGFYSGRTAELIVEQMRSSGGIITREDLAGYHVVERRPITGTYRGYQIVSMPPPSSGGVLLVEMLNMMEGYDFASIPYHSAQHAHILAEIMRRAYADRAEHLGDPDFVEVPTDALTRREYAKARSANITDRATPSDSVTFGDPGPFRPESPQTTHYSVVDRDGNCVSVTTTLNSSFGSKLVVDGAGFFLNNEMDDFSARPNTPNLYGLIGREANAIEPGKRMLSSMTPTIVLREGAPVLVVGTPGGSTIITTVMQTIHNRIDYGMGLVEAIESPRLHHQWRPDTIFYEKGTFSPGALDTLRSLGYTTLQRQERSGRVDAISIETDESGRRVYVGWSDSRGYGRAAGVE